MTTPSAPHDPADGAPDYLLVAEVLRPHGVRGELRVKILTDYPERLADLDVIFLGRGIDASDVRPYHIDALRFHQGYGLIKFAEIPDRNAAERLRGQFLMVAIADAVPLDEGEFYLYQLIDLEVRLEDGTTFGTLVEVLETGANDVYIIDSPRHGEVLIPAVDDYVLEVNIDGGYLVARIPEQLIPTRREPRHRDEDDDVDGDNG